MALRIVFMGTPDFAIPTLKALLAEAEVQVVGVITATDKYGGRRKEKLIESAVKKYAVSEGLFVMQPSNLKAEEFVNTLRSLNADLQVVVAFRMLPEVVWNMPPMGTLNLHGSLLPKYRGAAPINWAIIKGEHETGVTTFLLKHQIDTGDILLQAKTPIGENDTAGEIHDRLMVIGAELVVTTVLGLMRNTLPSIPQDPAGVTRAPKIFRETCEVDFDCPSSEVHNKIRGLSPYPGAWTVIDNKTVKLLASRLSELRGNPGQIILQDGEMHIACGDKSVQILTLQMEGKKRMETGAFLNGYQINSPEVGSK